MSLLVPVCGAILGAAVAVAVRRHARRRRLSRPWLWAVAVGVAFVVGPVALRPTLRPVYAHTFTSPHALGLAYKPPEAVATYLLGGSVVGLLTLVGYLWYCSVVLARRPTDRQGGV